MKILKPTKEQLLAATQNGTQLLLLPPHITNNTTTITCAMCGQQHSYVKKRKPKKFCSNKCACAFHGKYVRDKTKEAQRQKTYYKKHYARKLIVTSKQSVKGSGLQHSISEAHLNQQLSSGKCQVTGLPIKSNIGTGENRGAYSPSLDRIDNSVGYTDSNTRVVSWLYNLAKGKFTDRDVNNLAIALIASHLPPSGREDFKKLLPSNLISGLPAGYSL